MISIGWIQRLLLVIYVLTRIYRHYDLPLNRVISDGQFSNEGLNEVVNILLRNGRMDIVPMIYETMGGNFTRLEDFERNLLPYRLEFNRRRHPPDSPRPQIFYSYTRNGYPVQQETASNQTAQGHSDGQNSRDERVGHHRSVPQRPVLQSPSVSQAENVHPQHSQRSHRDPSRFIPRPQVPLFGAVTCCICGRNIQNTKTSPPILARISDIFMRKLTPEERQAFVNEVNKFDPRIFPFQANTPRQIVDALERCNLRGDKCILCLLNYAFQRIGRGDLAREVRQL